MKKILFLTVLIVCVSFAVSAQGLYFDIGVGLGKTVTELNGKDVMKAFSSLGADINEIAFDVDARVGYGPFGRLPLYAVLELDVTGHRIYNSSDSSDYIQFGTYLVGPGIMFYPIPFVQLGAALGFSLVDNKSSDSSIKWAESEKGFAWNISAAVDLGKGKNACLIGVKYYWAKDILNNTLKPEQTTSMFCVFVKYAFRDRAPSLF